MILAFLLDPGAPLDLILHQLPPAPLSISRTVFHGLPQPKPPSHSAQAVQSLGDLGYEAPHTSTLHTTYFGSNILTQTPIRRLLVALLPGYVDPLLQIANTTQPFSTAVVIDTLRFTTTACQAIALGARSIWVAPSVERAQQLATELSPRPLLCGERHCHPIAGFDLGNSPLELNGPLVRGRDLVYTTTNGTLAVEAVRQVPQILLAGLVNRHATCDYLRGRTSGDALLVCAGTDGQITWEDVLTAGAIVDELVESADFQTGHDAATLAQAAWRSIESSVASTEQLPQRLEKEFSRALGGSNLIASGYEPDLQFATQLDSLACVACNSSHHPHRFASAEIESRDRRL